MKKTGRLGDRSGEWPYIKQMGLLTIGIALFVCASTLYDGVRKGFDDARILALLIVFSIAVGPLAVGGAIFYLRGRNRAERRQLQIADGTKFSYIIGDTIPWYSEWHSGFTPYRILSKKWRGIAVELPVGLPHIYLDTRQTIGRLTPYSIDSSQRLDLEGNFPQTYRFYASHLDADEVLALFTPDVMEKFQQLAGDYDIEIYKNQLRIISRSKLDGRPDEQDLLVGLAGKLCEAIMRRVAILSQLKPRELEPLAVYRYRGVRLFGRYVPLWYLPVCFVLGLLVLFLWFGELVLWVNGEHRGPGSGSGAFLIVSVIPLAVLIVLTKLALDKPRVN
jgi:hypothetical protein